MMKLGKRPMHNAKINSATVYCNCSGHNMYYHWGIRLENGMNN